MRTASRGLSIVVFLSQLLICASLVIESDNDTSLMPRDIRNTFTRRRWRRASHLLGVDLKKVVGGHQRYGAVCTATQCHNRATCNVDDHAVGGFKCLCVRGFYGIHCENVDPDCDSNPCHNHAVCIIIAIGFKCQCVGQFFGDLCQYNKTTRNWFEDSMSVMTLVVCIAIIIVMLCTGILCCVVNAERQTLLDKYKWYIKLHMTTPTPTSYCYVLHIITSRYFGYVTFCCAPIYWILRAINYYILHRGHSSKGRYTHIPPPQRPNTPVQVPK